VSGVVLERLLRQLTDPYARKSFRNQVKSLIFRRGTPTDVREVKNLTDFWEAAHSQRKQLWLTGSTPSEVIARLDVIPDIALDDASILDVGVGLGFMVEYLCDLGKRTAALDVSQSALNRVKYWTSNCYRDASDLPTNSFSLIMHHLVAQHMHDDALRLQIVHLIRSLRDGGVIAMQFAAPMTGGGVPTIDQSLELQAGGGVTRTPEEMCSLIVDVGGTIRSLMARERWERNGSVYWVVKFS